MAEAPALQSFPVMSGDQVQLDFTVTDNDGAATDLTGGTGRFALAASNDGTIVVDSNASPQTATVTVTDAVGGLVNVVMTDETTEALEGTYYWAFKWTDTSGREVMIAHGYITFQVNLI